MSFGSSLAFGQIGESVIARWMRRRGNYVLPVYEKEVDTGKGPRLFCPGQEKLVAPDLFVFGEKGPCWVEAKHKTAFSWHRKTESWVTGIDLKHYLEYLQVDNDTPFPVWLMFLQRGGHAKDSPETSPSGLYANTLCILKDNESHRHRHIKHGKERPMVYWAERSLLKLAELRDL